MKKHKAKVLSKCEVEKNRSNAYDYIDFTKYDYNSKCDDVCKFYCTKGGTQPPECLPTTI